MTHAEGEPATRAHDVIARQVDHITHLIDDLLDIERVVSGKIRLNRQPLDLAEVVRRAVDTFAADARLDRHIDVSTEPVWVDGDAVRIEQVLTNILTNAVKYTPPGGRIRVALRADGADAVLSVEDSGVRHFAVAAALHLRHVRAGRPDHRPRAGRPRNRPGPRPPPGRAARGHGGRVERWRRARQQVHGTTEADSLGRNVLWRLRSRRNVVRSPGACF